MWSVIVPVPFPAASITLISHAFRQRNATLSDLASHLSLSRSSLSYFRNLSFSCNRFFILSAWQSALAAKGHRHSEHLPLLAVRQMYNALLQMHVTTSGKMPPKVPLPAKNLNFHLIMAHCVHTSQPPKRHGDRFSCVGGGLTGMTNTQTDRQRNVRHA